MCSLLCALKIRRRPELPECGLKFVLSACADWLIANVSQTSAMRCLLTHSQIYADIFPLLNTFSFNNSGTICVVNSGMHFLLIYSTGVPLFYCLLYVILRAVYSNDRYVSGVFNSLCTYLCVNKHITENSFSTSYL